MFPEFDSNQHPHRRYNPLLDEWILVSPHRSVRPWQGQIESAEERELREHDPNCFLCPGNTRINGKINPEYGSTFVFGNDFAALSPDIPGFVSTDNLLRCESVRGESKVICFSPHHSKKLTVTFER